jgi:protein-S-isoprenylcysteine O-methyltransferase Ste14
MTETRFFYLMAWGWCGVAAVVFASLFWKTAPYGRHAREGWGPEINRTLGWVIMEAPSALGFVFWYLVAPRPPSVTAWVFLGLWELHYVNRTFIFPFRMRGGQRRMPITVPLLAVGFNSVNAYLNARYLTAIGPEYPVSWLSEPRFVVGAALFVIGFGINYQSDAILRGLRKGNDSGYQIPRGGLYRFVSCPNYFGEILEWTGWALATWSPAGLTFVIWTAANLVPRAVSHHRWYRERFPDYPPERKAVLPLLI